MTVTMAEVRNRNNDVVLGDLTDFPNHDDFVKHISARIFGLLVETAGPIMEHFHGDLYYDAMCIREKVDKWNPSEDIRWVWSVNESGTDFREADTTLSQVRKECFLCTLSTIDKRYGTLIAFRMEKMNNG